MSAAADFELAVWQRTFARADRCPWPGPRPLGPRDTGLLVGRENDIREFSAQVENNAFVVLSGESGVGKSSLLEVGLAPALMDGGKMIAVCRDWSGTATKDAMAFLAEKVAAELSIYLPDLASDEHVFAQLSGRLGTRCVLVLDQFEELIRDAPGFAESMFDALIALNRTTKLHVVVSLRSEYLHRIDRLQAGVNGFSLAYCALKPVDAKHAYEVITSPAAGLDLIDEEAARLLADLWTKAREATVRASNDPFGRVGLLHLQALLYSLHGSADGGKITLEAVKEMLGGRSGPDLFVDGLVQAVDLKLMRCRAASDASDVGADRYLVEGTVAMLASTVRHLASDGFKLVRGVTDLFESALGQELDSLLDGAARAGESRSATEASDDTERPGDSRPTPDQVRQLLKATVDSALRPDQGRDLLAVSRDEIAALADAGLVLAQAEAAAAAAEDAFVAAEEAVARGDAPPAVVAPDVAAPVVGWARRLHVGQVAWVADPGEVTCGPMSGMAPAAVLIEEMRRFGFALAWLQASSLVRISSPGEAGTKVSLIHDGFGEALARWSRDRSGGATAALHAITAPKGVNYGWQFDVEEEPLPDLDGGVPDHEDPKPKLLVNLRWKGGWVRANLRNVAFVNCDLRGTYFDHCSLEAVSFVNCLLDGVVFSDCTIRGRSQLDDGDWERDAVVFSVPTADAAQLAAFARYRGVADPGDQFTAPVPLTPATPGRADEDALMWKAEPGGVTIYGGRLSSALVRSCTFATDQDLDARDGSGQALDVEVDWDQVPIFSLRRTAGSGIDVVEQPNGRFEIFASAVRHMTVTTAANRPSGLFSVESARSALFQVWLGSNLRGSFTVRNGLLAQVWNGSPDLRLTVDESPYLGVVNAAEVRSSAALDEGGGPVDLEVADPSPDQFIRDRARNMDYRRNPAAF